MERKQSVSPTDIVQVMTKLNGLIKFSSLNNINPFSIKKVV